MNCPYTKIQKPMNNPYFVNQYKRPPLWKTICKAIAIPAILISIPFSFIGIGFMLLIGMPVIWFLSIIFKFLTFTFNTLFGGHKVAKK
jgi:hypothetical protein